MKFFVILMALVASLSKAPVDYTKTAVVTEAENVITVVDTDGEEWQFDGEGWKEGDVIILLIDNNNTETKYDDIIVDVIKG